MVKGKTQFTHAHKRNSASYRDAEGNLRRLITSSFSDPYANGEVFEVMADLPANMGDAWAIASLAWQSSRAGGLELDAFLDRVREAAQEMFLESEPSSQPGAGGPSPFDWEAEYGSTALGIGLEVEVRRNANPKPSATEARCAALIAARRKANLGTRPDETIRKHAEKLRETIRYELGKLANK